VKGFSNREIFAVATLAAVTLGGVAAGAGAANAAPSAEPATGATDVVSAVLMVPKYAILKFNGVLAQE